MTVATWLRRLMRPRHPMHAQQPPVQQSRIVIEGAPISQEALDAVSELARLGWPYETRHRGPLPTDDTIVGD